MTNYTQDFQTSTEVAAIQQMTQREITNEVYQHVAIIEALEAAQNQIYATTESNAGSKAYVKLSRMIKTHVKRIDLLKSVELYGQTAG